jgi:hypothetical protein
MGCVHSTQDDVVEEDSLGNRLNVILENGNKCRENARSSLLNSQSRKRDLNRDRKEEAVTRCIGDHEDAENRFLEILKSFEKGSATERKVELSLDILVAKMNTLNQWVSILNKYQKV